MSKKTKKKSTNVAVAKNDITKEELEIIVDALMFNSCTDLSQEVDDQYYDKMVDLALKLTNQLDNFKSTRNYMYEDMVKVDESRATKIKDFVDVR